MVGWNEGSDRQITGEPFGLATASIFQPERNGALSCVSSELRPKKLTPPKLLERDFSRFKTLPCVEQQQAEQ
jgi:hypothetical protein